ncbi:hypothetical protein BABINDRAFT_163893 [Babjeviella inositovora NRRL Y-12698]|uniref:Isopenicillin N synthase-like Fe(2+) 2OG dioxygenase domain-containing protein n=1 Tax=Babjeviella inositovora NRRL Y-12698 TaxID=984486 RepID=A0A1E3QH30_9ASCO|nr:uncharacterized protein BABINDRAFT_163893 [Babjeviella inositovora NRRL Y-12698]ODQ76991.1 hypothetical protein BABINDRAFT_163893 [Babjeviella inositovora NRRL Y-12698]
MPSNSLDPVVVSLEDLKSFKCDHLLPEAFGPDSLGIIIVKDVSDGYEALRAKVLRSSTTLANLPPSILEGLESEESKWIVGWSCGKEKLANDTPDLLKGSYYVNCAFHKDPDLEGPTPDQITGLENSYTPYTTPNIWPAEEDIPDFQQDLKKLCNLIIDVAEVVAAACDRYCKQHIDNYPSETYLTGIVKNSYTTKARLLHYFASKDLNEQWCGEHLDHSCLTGLTSAMFLDEADPVGSELSLSPDPEAGLYIRNRAGDTVKVSIPRNCIAFQTGQSLQEITENKFKAVPHYVQGCKVPGVSRSTLAVFCQPNLKDVVNLQTGETFAAFADRILNANH